jgi:hypothetical protein
MKQGLLFNGIACHRADFSVNECVALAADVFPGFTDTEPPLSDYAKPGTDPAQNLAVGARLVKKPFVKRGVHIICLALILAVYDNS